MFEVLGSYTNIRSQTDRTNFRSYDRFARVGKLEKPVPLKGAARKGVAGSNPAPGMEEDDFETPLAR